MNPHFRRRLCIFVMRFDVRISLQADAIIDAETHTPCDSQNNCKHLSEIFRAMSNSRLQVRGLPVGTTCRTCEFPGNTCGLYDGRATDSESTHRHCTSLRETADRSRSVSYRDWPGIGHAEHRRVGSRPQRMPGASTDFLRMSPHHHTGATTDRVTRIVPQPVAGRKTSVCMQRPKRMLVSR